MPIKTVCPECNVTLNVPDTLAGKRVRCTKCKHVFAVPAANGDADEPVVEAVQKTAPRRSAPSPAPAPRRRPAPADEEEDEDAPRRPVKQSGGGGKTLLIVGGILGGLLLLCCGGVTGGFFYVRAKAKEGIEKFQKDLDEEMRKADEREKKRQREMNPVPGPGGPKRP